MKSFTSFDQEQINMSRRLHSFGLSFSKMIGASETTIDKVRKFPTEPQTIHELSRLLIQCGVSNQISKISFSDYIKLNRSAILPLKKPFDFATIASIDKNYALLIDGDANERFLETRKLENLFTGYALVESNYPDTSISFNQNIGKITLPGSNIPFSYDFIAHNRSSAPVQLDAAPCGCAATTRATVKKKVLPPNQATSISFQGRSSTGLTEIVRIPISTPNCKQKLHHLAILISTKQRFHAEPVMINEQIQIGRKSTKYVSIFTPTGFTVSANIPKELAGIASLVEIRENKDSMFGMLNLNNGLSERIYELSFFTNRSQKSIDTNIQFTAKSNSIKQIIEIPVKLSILSSLTIDNDNLFIDNYDGSSNLTQSITLFSNDPKNSINIQKIVLSNSKNLVYKTSQLSSNSLRVDISFQPIMPSAFWESNIIIDFSDSSQFSIPISIAKSEN